MPKREPAVDIRNFLPNIKTHVALAPHTSLRIGGPADYFYEAHTRDDIIRAVTIARETQTPYVILAGGTNVLVADEGFRGLTIKIRNSRFEIQDSSIIADAGVSMGVLVAAAGRAGLSGLEWAGGLPGTLGGAVFGNAGTFGTSIADILREIHVYNPIKESLITYRKDEVLFGYRRSAFKETGEVILGATLILGRGDPETIRANTVKSIQYRSTHHPSYDASCGCIFKNTERTASTEGIIRHHPDLSVWFDRIPTGYLVDEVGLKGYIVGGAKISEVHGNFIVNQGRARAEDIITLIGMVKERVKNIFGVLLEEEIQMIGFR